MDKAEFVERSPVYYALAIAVTLKDHENSRSEYSIRQEYPEIDEQTGETGSLIDRWPIWQRAVTWLLSKDMIKIKSDVFGPPIFSKSSSFDSQWDMLVEDENLPFSSYAAADHNVGWLVSALHSVENHFVNLDVKVEDFENPDAEWAPIKIDPQEATVRTAIASLEHVVEEIRSDNGYSATQPEERDFVLEGLEGTLQRLKSATISAVYVRTAIERLQMLSRRFAGTVKSAAIAGAKMALIEFSKRHFGDALNYVWKFFF